MMVPAIIKRASLITKGCAACNPILVAVEADGQRMAKNNPARNSNIPLDFSFACIPAVAASKQKN